MTGYCRAVLSPVPMPHLSPAPQAQQAARTYDRAALLMRGETAELNFPLASYANDPVLQALCSLPKQQMILALRKTADTEARKSRSHLGLHVMDSPKMP